ncbi:hypothetical protein SKAU_G00368290 [Synaphobranchus kaupii]|uniref:Uncharacterized protein n=1 Tax=Synaphobranchus kaupii TaxID=118154 RepID=A0A9Q1EFK3_SYNKA|nr:hypothetical protein SKAU_G00368290 [Synaphobranchus kaupii]
MSAYLGLRFKRAWQANDERRARFKHDRFGFESGRVGRHCRLLAWLPRGPRTALAYDSRRFAPRVTRKRRALFQSLASDSLRLKQWGPRPPPRLPPTSVSPVRQARVNPGAARLRAQMRRGI